jgi:hypothetical protein
MIRQAVYFYRVALLGGDYLVFFSWFFQQRYNTKSWGFLRCDQCVLALNLSYQTPPYDDLHFSVYNGCLRIFGPLVEGVKNKFSKYFQFSYDKRHIKPTAPEKARTRPPRPPYYNIAFNLWRKAITNMPGTAMPLRTSTMI